LRLARHIIGHRTRVFCSRAPGLRPSRLQHGWRIWRPSGRKE
jgi:hypothetical protein